MKIALVWNDKAGSTKGVSLDDVRRALGELGAEVLLECVSETNDCRACAEKALAAGADRIVAAGGDGTVSGVAAVLGGTGTPLGVLPLGTSNSFASALGISLDVNEALKQLVTLSPRPVDFAWVTGAGRKRTAMVLHCMVGFHAETVAETKPETKRRWGALAYLGKAISKLAGYEPFAVQLDAGDLVVESQATALAVANLAPPRTVLAHGPSHLLADDGKVDVTIVATDSVLEAIATGVHLYRKARTNEAAERDNVGSFASERVAIAAVPPQKVLVDGEAFGETPVTIETQRHGLLVVAPPPAEATGPVVDAALIGLPDLEVQPG